MPKMVGNLVFVGLGLHDDLGISMRGLNELRTVDQIFIELYTSLMPGLSLERLQESLGKTILPVSRKNLEEESGKNILDVARTKKVALLVPGDPLIATTHVALRIAAEKLGIKTSIIHGSSILSAAIGLSGLQNYKFGKSVTIPFPDETPPKTAYEVISQNKKLGLHTLCFLDIKMEEGSHLSVHEALRALLDFGNREEKPVVSANTLVVVIARAGGDQFMVKADYVADIMQADLGDPPHTLIFPGDLHFMEAEALITLANGPENLRRTIN